MEPIMLNVNDLTKILGIGRDTAYALMRNKTFPSMRIGARYMVDRKALNEWVEKNRYRCVKLD